MQSIITGFIIICFGMMLFNIIYILISSRKKRTNLNLAEKYEDAILKEISVLNSDGMLSDSHRRMLIHKLKKIQHMLAFEKTVVQMQKMDVPGLEAYLDKIHPAFIILSQEYYDKGNSMKKAYYAHLASTFRLCRPGHETIAHQMVELQKEDSLYCRQNAMAALCQSGNIPAIIQALKKLSVRQGFVNSRLATEDLMLFPGEKGLLSEALFMEFQSFSDGLKVAVLNYFRLSGSLQNDKIINIYENESNMEVRLACLRCFGVYKSPAAKALLAGLLTNYNSDMWEYTATAAFTLGCYGGEDIIHSLKSALHSRHWHVRYNAAQSLASLGISYSDVTDILNGEDRYAKEMLDYHMNLRQEMEAVGVGS